MLYFSDYGWFYAISMVAVIFALYYSINQLNNIAILNFGRAIRERSKRYQKSKNKVPEASHMWKKEPSIESKGLKCRVCLKSVLAPDYQNMNRCDVCGAAAHTNCSGDSHKDWKCVSMFGSECGRHQWAVQSVDTPDQSEEASFCCFCEEPCGGDLVADAPVLYCMWCRRLVHVDCHSNLAKETEDRCDLGPLKGANELVFTMGKCRVSERNKSAMNEGDNNVMATMQDMKATDVSALPINGVERKNGENEVDKLEFGGTDSEKRLRILLNPEQVKKKNEANRIATAKDLEAKKLKLIKTGVDANSLRTCTICNVVCNSDKAFASHIAGEKHMINSKGLAQVLMSQHIVYSANASTPDEEPRKKKKDKPSAVQAPTVAQSFYCDICNVTCYTHETYNSHVAGQKHKKKIKNLSMGDRPILFGPAISTLPGTQTPATNDNDQKQLHASSQMNPKPIEKSKIASKEDLEMKKRKLLESGAERDAIKICELCNVVSICPTVFESHCRGKKHRSMVEKQEENFGGLEVKKKNEANRIATAKDLEAKKLKLIKTGVDANSLHTCTICNVVCNSDKAFASHIAGEKHMIATSTTQGTI